MYLAFLGVAAVFGAIAAASLHVAGQLEEGYGEVKDETFPVITALSDARAATLRIVASTTEYALLRTSPRGNPEALDEELDLRAEGLAALEDASARLDAVGERYPHEAPLAARVRAESSSFRAASEAVLAAADRGDAAEVAEAKERFETREAALLVVIESGEADETASFARQTSALDARIAGMRLAVGVASVLALAVLVVATLALAAAITRPLARLEATAHALGAGRAAARAEVVGGDETARLAAAFNAMADDLDRSREALVRQERLAAVGTLAAGVAHEVNNPLAYMRSNAEENAHLLANLAASPDLPPSTREALRAAERGDRIVIDGIDRIARLTRGLSRVTRASGRDRSVVDVNEIARRAVLVAQPDLVGVVVAEDLSAERRSSVSKDEIQQLLVSLVLNAAEAARSAPEPRVWIRSRDRDGRVEVEVEDNGPGVPEDLRASLFVPFFTTKPQGTGLALSIGYRVAEDHGGSLRYEPASNGGARFVLVLPSAVAPPVS